MTLFFGDTKGKVTALVLVLLLALAGLGVAYGLWSKTLTIAGTVNTGDVDAEWTGAICVDFFHWPFPPEGTGEVGGKDVGSTTAVIDSENPQILHFTIDNGYPSYAVDCEVEYGNTGTIPWIVRGTTIVPVSPNLTNCTLIFTGVGQTKTLRCDQLTVVYVNNIGAQVDPGDVVASSLRAHVEQAAEEETTYEFEVVVCVGQWNEPATFGECIAAAP